MVSIERTFPGGVHGHEAALLSRVMQDSGATVTMTSLRTGETISPDRLLRLMTFDLQPGDHVRFDIDGGDAAAAIAVVDLVIEALQRKPTASEPRARPESPSAADVGRTVAEGADADGDTQAGRDQEPAGSLDPADLVARLAEELRSAEDRADMLLDLLDRVIHAYNNFAGASVPGYLELILEATDLAGAQEDARSLLQQVQGVTAVGRRALTMTSALVTRSEQDGCDLASVVRETAPASVIVSGTVPSPVRVPGPEEPVRALVRSLVLEVTQHAPGPVRVDLRVIPHAQVNPAAGRVACLRLWSGDKAAHGSGGHAHGLSELAPDCVAFVQRAVFSDTYGVACWMPLLSTSPTDPA